MLRAADHRQDDEQRKADRELIRDEQPGQTWAHVAGADSPVKPEGSGAAEAQRFEGGGQARHAAGQHAEA